MAGVNFMSASGKSGAPQAGWQPTRGSTIIGFPTAPAAPAAPVPAAPQTGTPGLGSITTSVMPAPIYTPQQTQWGVNQARAQAAQAADPRAQQKQFMSPGRSMDAGTMGAAMPGIAKALFQGQQQAAQIPLTDAFANQNNLLQGQIGQQQESNALMNLLAGYYENGINQRQQVMQSTVNPLLAMLGQGMGF